MRISPIKFLVSVSDKKNCDISEKLARGQHKFTFTEQVSSITQMSALFSVLKC